MKSTYLEGLPVFRFDIFTKFKHIIQFITTRKGGVSKGKCTSLNLNSSS